MQQDIIAIDSSDDEVIEVGPSSPLKRKVVEKSSEVANEVLPKEKKQKLEDEVVKMVSSKRTKNAENIFFRNIPFYQMRIIMSYLDIISLLRFSQSCHIIRSEILSRSEFWHAFPEPSIVPSINPILSFDSVLSSNLGISFINSDISFQTTPEEGLPSLAFCPIFNIKSFMKIYLSHFRFIGNTSRLILDLGKYMYNSIYGKDIKYIASSFSSLKDLQLLNMKFSNTIAQEFKKLSEPFNLMEKLENIKITFSLLSQSNEGRSLIESSEFSEFIVNWNCPNLQSFHIGEIGSKLVGSPLMATSEINLLNLKFGNLKSFGFESMESAEFLKFLFEKTSNGHLLSKLEEIFVSQLTYSPTLSTQTFPRHNLQKLIISQVITNNAAIVHNIVSNLPHLEYLDISLIPPSDETRPDGKVLIKSDILKQLRFHNFAKFYDSNLIQIDAQHLQVLELKYFGELLIINNEWEHLNRLDIKYSTILNGQLHSILTKCSNSLTNLTIESCSNIRTIHILKDPFSAYFKFIRTMNLRLCGNLEKISIACIGTRNEDLQYLYLQDLSLSDLLSLREFSFELGTNDILPRIYKLKIENCDRLETISPLQMTDQLTSLTFSGSLDSPLWNQTLPKHFKTMTELKQLNLWFKTGTLVQVVGNRITFMISSMKNLESLSIHSRFSTSSFMFSLNSSSLNHLRIISSNENYVEFYLNMPSLQKLEVSNISNVRVLSNNLYHLSIAHGTPRLLTIKDGKNSVNMHNKIRELHLNNVTFTNDVEQLFTLGSSITKLTVQNCTVRKLENHLLLLKSLKQLRLRAAMKKLYVQPSLEYLQVSSDSLKTLDFSHHEKNSVYNLVKINLASCKQFSKFSLSGTKSFLLPHLSTLDVRETSVGDSSIQKVISQAPNLSCIRSSGCTSISTSFAKTITTGNRKAVFN